MYFIRQVEQFKSTSNLPGPRNDDSLPTTVAYNFYLPTSHLILAVATLSYSKLYKHVLSINTDHLSFYLISHKKKKRKSF